MKNIVTRTENAFPPSGCAAFRKFLTGAAVCALAFPVFAQETNDYYWRGGTWNTPGDTLLFNVANNWAEDAGGQTLHQTPPSETSNVFFDWQNLSQSSTGHARVNIYQRSETVNSINASVAAEFHIQSGHFLNVLSDWNSRVSSDYKYTVDGAKGYDKALRIAADTLNFLTIGGDMTLSTDKYFSARIRLGSAGAGSGFSMSVGGALNFVKNGADTDGYHAFDMAAIDSTRAGKLSLNLGGLRSSGKAVYMTTGVASSTDILFSDNSSGAFAGGSFEGVFAADSGVSSQLDITMNGSGRQEMTIYKASNGSLHGFENDLDGKADMSIGNLTVNNGEFVMNTEVAVENLYLSGGRLKFSSAEKVGGMTIDGGTLLFGGTINVGDLTVAAYSADVVFSAEDLAAHEITVFEFDYLTDDFDANSVFSAYNEFGQELGGRFELTGGMGGSGSLVYVVPEPAAVAAFIGAAALMFALRRGGRR